jgi:hypothetical protein
MDTVETYQIDPPDMEAIRLTARLSASMRIRRLLNTRALLVAIMRGRLQRQYPHVSARELNLKVLEEIERVEKSHTRPHLVS